MTRLFRTFSTLALLLALAVPASAIASHFRQGQITWSRTNPANRTVAFTIVTSWRQSFGSSSFSVTYAGGQSSGSYSTTTGSGTNLGSFTDSSGEQYWTWRHTDSRTYSSDGPFTVFFTGCCRIGNLSNAANDSYRVEAVVNLAGGNTGGPASGAPAILQMVEGAFNSITLPVADPDGNALVCSQASSSQSSISTWAAGLTVVANGSGGCNLEWNVPAGTAGNFYAYAVQVQEAPGGAGAASTVVDAMIEIVTGSPPSCSPDRTINAVVGTPVSTSFTGTPGPSGNNNLTAQLLNGPPGSSLSPTAGSGSLVTNFSWTPSASDFGQSYGATVIIQDGAGLQDTCALAIQVPTNNPPTAQANGPYTGVKGVGVPVSGVGSNDIDGSISQYAWDCDGDGAFEVTTAAVGAVCGPYTLGGTYNVTLRVTDNIGATGTDTTTITVANVGPTAEAAGPYLTPQASPVVINGSASFDGDGGALTYGWDCDLSNGVSFVPGSATFPCTYDDGNYTGRLQVCDPEGACDTDDFTVTSTNTGPVANAGGPYTTGQGVAVGVNGSGSTDPDGSIATYEWDCDASNGISFSPPIASPAFSCVPPDDGVYVVTLRVTDDDGATDTDTATLTATNTAPLADAGGPYTGNKNASIVVTGAGSVDPDGTLAAYQWDCDASDGVLFLGGSAQPTFSCSYPAVGVYTVSLQVIDDDGATAVDTATVTITNAPPIANAGGPYAGIQGTPITMDGSGSSDPVGFIASYAWDCGLGGGFSAPQASPIFSCVYPDVGSYTATLRVTDDDGAIDTATASVTVSNASPTAEAGGPYTGGQSAAMPVFAFGSNDPDGTLVLYEWDCTSDGVYDTSSSAPTGSTCLYPNIGTYTITLRVTDDDGATDTDTAVATIGNQPPVSAPGGPYAALQSTNVLIDGSQSTDVDGVILTFQWDCDASNGVSYISSGSTPVFVCSYPTIGTYTVTLQVTDDDGATDVEVTQVIVSNGAPVAVAGGPYTGNKNTSITLDGSASSDADGAIVNYAWDCTSDGVIDAQGTSPTAACVYLTTGTFTATLTVTDNDGTTAIDTAVVNVPVVGPIAEAGGPYAGTQGQPVAVDASLSFDSDGSIVTYEWDCEGDGIYEYSVPTPTGLTCTWPGQGTYTVTLRVTDDDGASDIDTAVATIGNLVPVADAGGPYIASEGNAIPMNGGGSVDVDGSIVLYSWDCDSDGVPDALSPLANASTCSYTTIGSFTVTLTVTDNNGATDTDTATVVINSSPPTADAGGPYTANEGALALLNGGGSSDQGGAVVLWEWDCTSDGIYDVVSSAPLGQGCTYPDEGNFTVTLRVTDDDGDIALDTATVAVSNVDPTLVGPAGPATGTEGVSLNWSATATDPGVADVLTYSWDFGDGEAATGTSVSHVYAEDGVYTVTVTVEDGDGGSDANSVTVTIGNAAPQFSLATVPNAANEGQTLLFTAVATDLGATDTLTYTWDFGDGGTETGDIVNYAYVDDGTFTVTVTVTDDEGASDVTTATIVVANVAPVITQLSGDLSGFEGDTLSWTGAATDAGLADVLTFTWDFGDGNTGTGETASNVYANEGQYLVTLTVTDDDGGTTSATATVVIGNAAPVISALTAPGGDEGVALSWSVAAADAGVNDTVTFLWDFGDGTFASGAAVNKTFTDDGTFNVGITATDSGGAQGFANIEVVIGNVAPVITSLVAIPNATPDEGTELDFQVAGTDQGTADIPDLLYTWDFGDGTPVVAASSNVFADHTYADDGAYTLTVTVDDQDGGTSSASLLINVVNVAPTISTSPAINALEGALYSYAPQVQDPGDEVFTWTIAPSAPAAMTIDPATGLIQWTPTYDDFLTGSFTVVLTVDDGDGAIDQQVWTITVFSEDSDGDGMPDAWETDNGLDPFDPTDAGQDPDADGITNLGEFGLGQDPFVYDGPTAPSPVAPIAGVEIIEVSPDLVVDNATDPQNEVLLYDFELYEDVGLTTLVTSGYGVQESATGQTLWKVDLPLAEDQEYWWVARANDPWTPGPWTAPESFVLNAINDGPEAPELVYPIAGEIVTVLSPTLEWTQVVDPNGDAITYDILVYADDETTVVAQVSGVPDSGAPTSTWTVDVALADDSSYVWTARAVDEEGLLGPWAELEDFFLTTENGAPEDPVFISPFDGEFIDLISPLLVATEVADPEGGAVVYEFEVDQSASFNSPAYAMATVPETGTGEVWWDLDPPDIELVENAWAFARVRAVDELGIASAPDTITFFVRGPNDAAPVPTLLRPEDGSVVPGQGLVLVLGNVQDPELDAVFYDFVIARDAELLDVVFSSDGVLEGAGPEGGEQTTSVLVPQALDGEYFWSARSVDDRGARSDWADPFRFTTEEEADDGRPDVLPGSFVSGGGCSACQSSVAPGGASWWLLALLPGLAVLRRRR